MIVLSCFDGMSCGQIVLNRAGIHVDKYYASEVDKYAIQVTMKNNPSTIQLGDITKWREWNIEKPDMIIGGSPCQGFSFAGKGLSFQDERSKLFFVFADILKHYKPKYFLLENVVMEKQHNDVISGILGDIYPECVIQTEMFRTGRLEPIQINSALVSAQNRERLYWTNIQGITQPKDKGLLLKDIIDSGFTDRQKSYCITASYHKGGDLKSYFDSGRRQLIFGGAFRGRNPDNPSDRRTGSPTEQRLELNTTGKANCWTSVSKDSLCIQVGEADINGNDSIKRVYSVNGKCPCLSACAGGNQEPKIALPGFENKKSTKMQHKIKNNIKELTEKSNCLLSNMYKGAQSNGHTVISDDNITWRKLTPLECERLQTVPDNYSSCVSNSQRYKMLGNGWTVDIIAHIFSFIKGGI